MHLLLNITRWLFLFCFLLISPGRIGAGERPLILAHYMPWYSSKPESGRWGWHWTMNHFNPDKVDKLGQREIASHDYPLIGAYDSGDPYTLEYHVLQMKFAGIDGVVVDWYGIDDFREYKTIHQNTERLLEVVKKAGLKFAVCYEDRTVRAMVDAKKLTSDDVVPHAANVMKWMNKNWFGDAAYVKLNNRPILPVFGPMVFSKPAQWDEIFSNVPTRPVLFGLPHLSRQAGAERVFGWPPVSGGSEITPTIWRKYLADLYARVGGDEFVVGVVFPGFHDIYEEAGLHESYGFIDDRDGETFKETLDLALKSKSPLIQIASWNDFGEGTVVEPTQQTGYRYLELLQQHTSLYVDFSSEDLRLPLILYQLRKNNSKNELFLKKLEHVSALLFSSRCAEARIVLKSLLTVD